MKDLQAMDRAHRIGQKKVVNVYRLITRSTLEEKIMKYVSKTIKLKPLSRHVSGVGPWGLDNTPPPNFLCTNLSAYKKK